MDRSAWLENRKKSLGASEVAAVCGLDPFKSALDVWASKMGIDQSSENDATELGQAFEAPILSIYARRTGYDLRQPGTLYRADFPWMSCTPDGIASKGAAERLVQVKLVGEDMTEKWRDGSLFVVPDYVQLQVQWEMSVAGHAVNDVAVVLGGTAFQILPVERNERVIGYLVEICGRFWRDFVQTRRPPPVTNKDAETLAAVFPQALTDARDAVPEMESAILRRLELSATIKTAEQERDLIDNTLRLAIGDAKGMRYPGGFVRWAHEGKSATRRLRFMRREP